MVILEKWEPIISPAFPSQIPLWISLRGLPLHYWKRELLYSIGDKIGNLKSFELTSSSAKIKSGNQRARANNKRGYHRIRRRKRSPSYLGVP
ncbi:unnamed protein product [Microthlaspi erraticum]|uniref:Uncharacterized protein n=1 Tax=Microthlaspi erraticum TaxID=1685480 RepID=A0A6D2K4I5_9BRAS|nr:unnamed protein product [Microthlaspi erraticum]